MRHSDRTFRHLNGWFLAIISLTMLAPIVHLIAVSLSSAKYTLNNLVYFWPRGTTGYVYERLVQMPELWRAMGVSVYITVLGTFITLVLNASLGYSLSRRQMKGRRFVINLVLITFVFSIGLIPGFLIVKELGMLNTLWALMVPNATAAFYIIIFKSFFQGISYELFEAAKVDGCSEYRIFSQLVIPLSLPVFATIALFHAVGQWNSYFTALIFLRNNELYPLQLVLRNLVMGTGSQQTFASTSFNLPQTITPQAMKAGVIIFSTIPIAICYPFLQKYFAKGAMLGGLKE